MNIMNLKGANKAAPKGGLPLVTGIGSVFPLAVNFTNEEYTALTGKELPYTLSYDLGEDDNGKFRPVHILVKSVMPNLENYHGIIRFRIYENDFISKAGDKVQSMDPKGVIAWNLTAAGQNVDYNWFDAANSKPLKRGEENIHEFFQKLTRYDNNHAESNWAEALNSINLTGDRLFAGDMSGIRSFIEYANSQQLDYGTGHRIGALWTVRETPRKDKETGEEVPGEFNYNQNISSRYFFYTDDKGLISTGTYKVLKDMETKQEAAGYSITNDLYTYKFQPFVKEDCRGVAPEETVEETTGSGGEDFWN